MAKDDILESTDEVIDLIDIVQPSTPEKDKGSELVDFDTQFSDLLKSGDPISLDDIPDLDELFADELEEKQDKKQESDALSKSDSDDLSTFIEDMEILSQDMEEKSLGILETTDTVPEDLDALLDNLFSEGTSAETEKKVEISDQNVTLSSSEVKNTEDKTSFLEKALDGIDDLDELLSSESFSQTIESSPVSSDDTLTLNETPRPLDETLSLSKRKLDDISMDTLRLTLTEEKESSPKEVKKMSTKLDIAIDQVSHNDVSLPVDLHDVVDSKQLDQRKSLDSVTASIAGASEEIQMYIQQLEENIQVLTQRVSALELIIMDHEAEVEALQESNLSRLSALEAQGTPSLQIDTLVEEVFKKMQVDIDKAAAAAAVRIIREEIEALLHNT